MRNQNPKLVYTKLLDELTPSMRYDGKEDFFSWQKNARAKLWDLLGLDFFEKCDLDFKKEFVIENDDYTEIRFSFQSEPGYYVPAHLLIPKKLEGKKLIPMICLQGHSKGMHISLARPKYKGDEESIAGGDRDFAFHAMKNGYCPIVMEQRYMGECGGDSEGCGCNTITRRGIENNLSVMPSLLMGRCAIGERVWDITRMIDAIIANFPELDSDSITCMGNSGGGTATFYAACIDERIKAAMPSCAIATYKNSIGNKHHCVCNYIPGIARYFDMGDLGGLIAPRKLVVINGRDDSIFPLSSAQECMTITKKLYEYAGCPENAAHVVGEGKHRFYAEIGFKKFNELFNK